MTLIDLGFSKGVIAETIVSTYCTDLYPNAAPMGVIMESEQQLVINLFNSSLTYSNLKKNKLAVLNLTSDIELFYKSAFKEVNSNGKLPQEWFEKAEIVNAPRLRMSDASIEVSVQKMAPIGLQKTQTTCKVELIKARHLYPKVYCRAFSATIEAIIHATRIKPSVIDGKEEEYRKLLGIIDYCNSVVNRVAPNSSYSSIMADLTKRINSWRK
jgi:hypothetical protein